MLFKTIYNIYIYKCFYYVYDIIQKLYIIIFWLTYDAIVMNIIIAIYKILSIYFLYIQCILLSLSSI